MQAFVTFFALLVTVSSYAGPGASLAKPLSSQDQDAMQKTQDLLRDKAQRQKAVGETQRAREADQHVQNLAPEAADQQAIYELAADVFPVIVQEANGDPAKMDEMLQKYLRNPASFADKFTPEQKAKLKALATKLDQAGAKAAKP